MAENERVYERAENEDRSPPSLVAENSLLWLTDALSFVLALGGEAGRRDRKRKLYMCD